MAIDTFISYSHEDKTVADAICATMETHGIRCWIAPRDVLPGMDWSESIIEALSQSKIMVVVISSLSNQSAQVRREVERAVSKGVVVVPFRIEDVPLSKSLEYFLSTPHWLDALTPPLEQHLENLARTVARILARSETTGDTREVETQSHPNAATPIHLTPPSESQLEFLLRRTEKEASASVGLLYWLWWIASILVTLVAFSQFSFLHAVVISIAFLIALFITMVGYLLRWLATHASATAVSSTLVARRSWRRRNGRT